jgi:hypothetical protein
VINCVSECLKLQLVKDPKALKEKIVALWEELSQDEPENQKRPANLEELTVMVTRELARRVVHLANYLRAGTAALPHNIAHSLHLAADYCIHLADVILKVKRHYHVLMYLLCHHYHHHYLQHQHHHHHHQYLKHHHHHYYHLRPSTTLLVIIALPRPGR